MSVGARPIARQALPPRAIAVQIAQLIWQAGSYRWMVLYAVTARDRGDRLERIGVACYPRCPVTQGLSVVAVAGRRAVMVNGASAGADRRALQGCAAAITACLATAHRVGELGM
jgi:hypothetical protein